MNRTTHPLSTLIWGENRHEKSDAEIAKRYPEGMHSAIAAGISPHLPSDAKISTVTLDDPEHGLSEETLAATDVLVWWGHMAHYEVSDEVVERVQRHVLAGMGLVVLHSGHYSKIFIKLMGTTCSLAWRGEPDRELVWTVDPTHPIAQGVPNPILIEQQEMYGEFFDVPTPDELIFISAFTGGEVFRSGCTWKRGKGRIFFFSPGDQEYPVYYHPDVLRVIANGVQWVNNESTDRLMPELRRAYEGEFTPRNESAR